LDLKLTRPGRKVVEVDGEKFSVRVPTLGDQKGLQKKLESLDKNSSEATDAMIGFLDELGFPKSVSESLTIEDLTQVIEMLGKKKN